MTVLVSRSRLPISFPWGRTLLKIVIYEASNGTLPRTLSWGYTNGVRTILRDSIRALNCDISARESQRQQFLSPTGYTVYHNFYDTLEVGSHSGKGCRGVILLLSFFSTSNLLLDYALATSN